MVLSAAEPGTSPAQVVGTALVGTMLAMAIVEHLLLVLPIPSTALWRWALRGQASAAAVNLESHDDLLRAR
jgi:putative photosynthetic complex assembly protein 2